MAVCLHQLENKSKVEITANSGDCSICTADYKNKYCKNYIPLILFEVKDEKEIGLDNPALS